MMFSYRGYEPVDELMPGSKRSARRNLKYCVADVVSL